MEEGQSSEADSCSAGKEIICLLWNPGVHYHVHMSSPPDPPLTTSSGTKVILQMKLWTLITNPN